MENRLTVFEKVLFLQKQFFFRLLWNSWISFFKRDTLMIATQTTQL